MCDAIAEGLGKLGAKRDQIFHRFGQRNCRPKFIMTDPAHLSNNEFATYLLLSILWVWDKKEFDEEFLSAQPSGPFGGLSFFGKKWFCCSNSYLKLSIMSAFCEEWSYQSVESRIFTMYKHKTHFLKHWLIFESSSKEAAIWTFDDPFDSIEFVFNFVAIKLPVEFLLPKALEDLPKPSSL